MVLIDIMKKLANKWLRLRHNIYGTYHHKNIMERFIQQIKDRTD
jgi:hypothetical protein